MESAPLAPTFQPADAAQLAPERREELRTAARALEANFLAEMLRHTGLGEPRESGGGGAGEEAFAGFLADAYGEALADRGGIGLAESIFQVLVAREEGSA